MSRRQQRPAIIVFDLSNKLRWNVNQHKIINKKQKKPNNPPPKKMEFPTRRTILAKPAPVAKPDIPTWTVQSI